MFQFRDSPCINKTVDNKHLFPETKQSRHKFDTTGSHRKYTGKKKDVKPFGLSTRVLTNSLTFKSGSVTVKKSRSKRETS